MSVSAPSSPPPALPPTVTVTVTSPRARRPSLHSHSEIALGLSRTPSPASSSSSHRPRPGILRSASVGTNLYSEGGATSPPQGISFAPLPEIAPRKRKSSRALGLAARSEMLRAQAERRAHQQQEQDLAWEDLAQLMKDASNLLKRVVGKAPKKGQQQQQQPGSPQPPPQPGLAGPIPEQEGVPGPAQPQKQPDAQDLSLLNRRSRSPPPPPPSKDDENHRDSGFAEDVDADEDRSRASTPQPQP